MRGCWTADSFVARSDSALSTGIFPLLPHSLVPLSEFRWKPLKSPSLFLHFHQSVDAWGKSKVKIFSWPGQCDTKHVFFLNVLRGHHAPQKLSFWAHFVQKKALKNLPGRLKPCPAESKGWIMEQWRIRPSRLLFFSCSLLLNSWSQLSLSDLKLTPGQHKEAGQRSDRSHAHLCLYPWQHTPNPLYRGVFPNSEWWK